MLILIHRNRYNILLQVLVLHSGSEACAAVLRKDDNRISASTGEVWQAQMLNMMMIYML